MRRRDCYLPATSQTPSDLAGPRPQNMSADERLSIGLLSLTVRVHLVPWSVEPTQSCCHVEWAEADATAARITRADFIVNAGSRKKRRIERVDGGYRLKPARIHALSTLLLLLICNESIKQHRAAMPLNDMLVDHLTCVDCDSTVWLFMWVFTHLYAFMLFVGYYAPKPCVLPD
jgi:hypothetical protein